MKLFLRYFLPISYFQATRLNRWDLVAYNGLVEWIPAIVLSFYYRSLTSETLGMVLLSYLAFICVYEIGYITNDAISEKFEDDPRGRSEQFGSTGWVVWALIGSRVFFWSLISYVLSAFTNYVWIFFHIGLLLTFVLHNSIKNEYRTGTFFGLSTYRYLAPMILTIGPGIMAILLPAALLNNSLYRTTVYLRNKASKVDRVNPRVRFKLLFYLSTLPLSVLFSIYFNSLLPTIICLYFMLVWCVYWIFSKVVRKDLVSP